GAEEGVAWMESEERGAGGRIHVGMRDSMLTGGEDVAGDSVEAIGAVDGAGSRQIVHHCDYLFRNSMHVNEHDSIQRALTRREPLATDERAPDFLKARVHKAPSGGQVAFRDRNRFRCA